MGKEHGDEDEDLRAILPHSLRNSMLVDLWDSDAGGTLAIHHLILMQALFVVMAMSVCLVFSGILPISLEVYAFFIRLHALSFPLLGAGAIGCLLLHVANWYDWPLGALKVVTATLVAYVVMAGAALQAKVFPGAPLIVVFMQYPVCMGLFRFWVRGNCSSAHFHALLAVCCFTEAFAVLGIWLAWIGVEGMQWTAETKGHLQASMVGVHQGYNITGWAECAVERGLGLQTLTSFDKTLLAACQDIELVAYLIWICPLIEFVLLMFFGVFCVLRVMMLSVTGSDWVVRTTLFAFGFFLTGMWVSASAAGASMGLASLLMGAIGVMALGFSVWLVLSINIVTVFGTASSSVMFKIAAPMMMSDWAAAAMLCATNFSIFLFLGLEVFTRMVHHVIQYPHEHPCITDRGLFVCKMIARPHWASVIEKAFKLCLLYMVFFVFTKATPVFLSWLNGQLQSMTFSAVIGIFYLVGLIMFLLPPVPGVPVYMASGVIIVARGQQEPWLGFWTGVLFASVLSLILKLNAVALQQVGIGQVFGRSLYVQSLVGVHTTSIRAIEKILKRPGMSYQKVFILCGGPDWPTSVLTGILKLSCPQMLLGTLPCFFLIIPSVLAGASILNPSLKSLSPLMIMLVGITQGGAGLGALVFIGQEAERSHEELSMPRPEHAELVKEAEQSLKARILYKKRMEWHKLFKLQKILLCGALWLVWGTCAACVLMGSKCFRKFEIGNKIEDTFDEGGLNGSVFNLATELGLAVLAAMAAGCVLFVLYSVLGMILLKSSSDADPAHQD